MCVCVHPLNKDVSQAITGTFFQCLLLLSFLDESCNKFDNMLICGDMNLPKISWDSSESSTSTCEQCFVDILNDHFLLQVNCLPPCGNYVLDLVISSMPDQVNAFEVINPDEVAIFTDHCLFICFILF